MKINYLIIAMVLHFFMRSALLVCNIESDTSIRATRILSEGEKVILENILTKYLEEDLLTFLFNYQQIQSASKKLQHIHGVQMLSELCTTHNDLIQAIRKRKAQWHLLCLWVHKQLAMEEQRNDLLPHLHLLEQKVNLPQGSLQTLAQEKKYANMFELLVEQAHQISS